jgi:hemoglobin
MARAVSSSITRRSVVAGLALTAAPMSGLAGADSAHAQAKQTASEKSAPDKSLYDRLGGVFAIAAVVDHFSDAVVKNPIVGQKSKNPKLREWHTKNLERLPGLKFMRTLWVCNAAGGPFQFTATKPGKTPLGLEEAHRDLQISPAEFDEVAAELGRTLDFAKVPKREKAEVLAAFAAHKDEVTAGAVTTGRGG